MEQNLKYEYDIVLIDPTSPDISRGSFCYLPYIYYNALKEQGVKVKLYEDFTVPQLDSLPTSKKYIVFYWSYPQTEICKVLKEFISGEVEFSGYYPFVDKENFKKHIISDEDILLGIKTYPKYFDDFKYLLLCDDDMHLKKYAGTIYPLFTSYGCPQHCAFCSTAINCNHTRIELSIQDTVQLLDKAHKYGVRCVHFTDEDFFWNTERLYSILKYMVKYDFKCIALGSVGKVQQFVDKYGEQLLIDAGIKIIEVGFETGDKDLSKLMMKAGADKCIRLADSIKKVDLFWLTMSFFPGETIHSLNETGAFLRDYGYKIDEVYGRIATNGTEGGLGQFFLPYTGTKGIENLSEKGIILSSRPLRLLPSFIPNSFLDSVVKEVRQITEEDIPWFRLYNIDPFDYVIYKGKPIREQACSVKDFQFFGVCARLNIIR